MRYTEEIERGIIEQIQKEPDRPIVLPDWAYWGDTDSCYILVDGYWTPLMRHLFEMLIQPLPEQVGLANPPGVPKRNVNPRLAVVLATRHSRAACPKGHAFSADDYRPGVGYRCKVCREAWRKENLKGTPSVADINRAKTHCPNGHPLERGNLIHLRDGRRKCRTCHRDTQARYRARKKES